MGILNINYGFFEFWVVEEQVTEVESGKHCNSFLAHCIYVPKDLQLQHDITHAHHNTNATWHPGHWKTLELIS